MTAPIYKHRKGFAFIVAITTMVFVTMAAMAVMNQFTCTTHRTQNEAKEAQLRQNVYADYIARQMKKK